MKGAFQFSNHNSIRGCFRLSVRRSVGLSVRRSVRNALARWATYVVYTNYFSFIMSIKYWLKTDLLQTINLVLENEKVELPLPEFLISEVKGRSVNHHEYFCIYIFFKFLLHALSTKLLNIISLPMKITESHFLFFWEG